MINLPIVSTRETEVGPDGKIVAKGLRGSKIKDAVAAALGSK